MVFVRVFETVFIIKNWWLWWWSDDGKTIIPISKSLKFEKLRRPPCVTKLQLSRGLTTQLRTYTIRSLQRIISKMGFSSSRNSWYHSYDLMDWNTEFKAFQIGHTVKKKTYIQKNCLKCWSFMLMIDKSYKILSHCLVVKHTNNEDLLMSRKILLMGNHAVKDS